MEVRVRVCDGMINTRRHQGSTHAPGNGGQGNGSQGGSHGGKGGEGYGGKGHGASVVIIIINHDELNGMIDDQHRTFTTGRLKVVVTKPRPMDWEREREGDCE